MKQQGTPVARWSRREVRGLLVLCLALAVGLGLQALWKQFNPPDADKPVPYTMLDSLQQELDDEEAPTETRPLVLKKFDPNSVDSVTLLDLGFSPRQARSLLNYRRHGGTFKTKASLAKLYNMTPALLAQLMPYVLLPDSLPSKSKKPRPDFKPYEAPPTPVTLYANELDTTLMDQWPMIGKATAKRIVDYQNRLGGFVDTSQFKEVWGLMPEQVQTLKQYLLIPTPPDVKRIAINRCTEQELRRHPYISFKQVRVLLAFRSQHGAYHTWADVLRAKALTEAELSRLRPYLNLEY